MKERFFPQASGDMIWTIVGSPLFIITAYLVVVNIWAFALMGYDKRRAKIRGARRIRERTLFLSALLGGGAGACLGMWTFRHKTRHWYFVVGIPLILLAEITLGWWVYRQFF